MKQLDLGCGGAKRQSIGYDYFGVDINPAFDNVKKADLVFDEIPFGEDEFEFVTAYDFMEHIPMILYVPNFSLGRVININGVDQVQSEPAKPIRLNPMINLFNEIYRVLKPDGKFYMQSPVYPDRSVFQDPTHMSFWTDETINYFSGDYYGWHDHYNHKSRFELVEKHFENGHICITLRALKGLEWEGEPYQVHY